MLSLIRKLDKNNKKMRIFKILSKQRRTEKALRPNAAFNTYFLLIDYILIYISTLHKICKNKGFN